MSKKDTLKLVVKKVAPKATYGTDPTNPWSMKANINEDRYLDQFLSTRGINPKFVTKNIKVAHSKSNDYLNWRKSHVDEGMQTTHTPTAQRNKALVRSTNVHKEIRTGGMHQGGLHTEETDKKDMVCFDIPLLIRVLEFTREDMSSDIELHNMVERLINMRETSPLTMKEYDSITQKLVKENHIAIAMGKMLDDEGSMVLSQLDEIERSAGMIRDYIGKDYEKQLPSWVQAKITIASDYISTVGTYLVSKNEKVNEETLDEISTSTLASYRTKAGHDVNARALGIAMKRGSGRFPPAAGMEKDVAKRQSRMAGITKASQKLHAKGYVEPEKPKTPDNGDRGYGKGRYMGDSVELEGEQLDELSKGTLNNFIKKSKETYKDVPNERKGNRLRNVLKAASKSDAKVNEETFDESKMSAAMRLSNALGREKAKSSASIQRGKEMMDKIKQDVKAKSEKPTVKEDMMKSARIIKSIYKKKNMKEEMYDHEKDDKGNQSYGKPPKVGKSKAEGEDKTQAAAVLKGGTTLTGQGRDTIEIDPMMRTRPTNGASPETDRSKKSIA